MQGIPSLPEFPTSAEPAQPVAPTPKPKRPTVPKNKTESACPPLRYAGEPVGYAWVSDEESSERLRVSLWRSESEEE